MITEETLDILDDIEDISDMIVQSDIYVSYRLENENVLMKCFQ